MATKFTVNDDSFAVITWQNLFGDAEADPAYDRVGKQFRPVEKSLLDTKEIVKFRLRDEDNEIHYKGLVRDDDDCECQSILSDWGAADTGGFIIEVRRNGEWVMEIG
jgi:hypothetical protein